MGSCRAAASMNEYTRLGRTDRRLDSIKDTFTVRKDPEAMYLSTHASQNRRYWFRWISVAVCQRERLAFYYWTHFVKNREVGAIRIPCCILCYTKRSPDMKSTFGIRPQVTWMCSTMFRLGPELIFLIWASWNRMKVPQAAYVATLKEDLFLSLLSSFQTAGNLPP